MPRMERIRITGVRYENMRKRHEDTLLDLCNEDGPQHTLITLVNGGGKGLLLQMIFQLLLPKTTWGKNGENRVEALFYNERKAFRPYTFHVGIEWCLDTEPLSWLMTGIAVTAKEKQRVDETEENPSDIHYLLYTQTYRKPHDWDLAKMPLYDAERREGVEMEELKAFLDRQKSLFQTFSPSRLRDYYDYLASFGIEKGDWQVMRKINKEEGGVEAFFSDGQDNDGLFRHKIIPTISQYLQTEEAEGLVPLFRSSVKIAQDLPKLMAREASYREMQEVLRPLKDSLENGLSEKKRVEAHQEKGEILLGAIHGWQQTLGAELEKWGEEKEREEERQRDWLWQEANLSYAKQHRKVKQMKDRLEQIMEQKRGKAERVAALEQEVKRTHLHYLLRQWSDRENQERETREEIEQLQKSMEASPTAQELERLRKHLAEAWDRAASLWADHIAQVEQAKREFQDLKSATKEEIEQTDRRLVEKKGRAGTLSERIKEFNGQAIRMANRYGAKANTDPEAVLREHQREYEQRKENLAELKRQLEEYQREKERVIAEHSALTQEKEQHERNLVELEEAYHARRKGEESLYMKLRSFFPEWSVENRGGMGWLQEAARRIEERIAKVGRAQKEEEEAYWMHQLDRSLQTEEYWIPNRDLAQLYRHLEAANIQAVYGTEFLKDLSYEASLTYIRRYPLLPYGLVIWKADEKRLKTLFSSPKAREWFLRSPVPIYSREIEPEPHSPMHSPMEGEGDGWFSDQTALYLHDFGMELALSDERWDEWRESLEKEEERFKAALTMYEEQVNSLREIWDEIRMLLRETSSAVWRERMEDEKKWLTGVEDRLQQLISRETELEEAVRRVSEKSLETEEFIRRQEEAIGELKRWIDRVFQYKGDMRERDEVLQEIHRLETEKRSLEERYTRLENGLNDLKDNERHWRGKREKEFEEVKKVLTDAAFPAGGKGEYEERVRIINEYVEVGITWEMDTGQLLPLAREALRLKQSVEEKEAELLRLQERLIQLNWRRKEKETEMEDVTPDWPQVTPVEGAEEVLKRRWRMAEQEYGEEQKQLQALIRDFERTDASCSTEQEHLFKSAQEVLHQYGKEVDPWEEIALELKEQEIVEGKAKSSSHLREVEQILDDLRQKIGRLDNNQKRMGDQGIRLKLTLEIPQALMESVKREPDRAVEAWIEAHKRFKEQLDHLKGAMERERSRLLQKLEGLSWDATLKENLKQAIHELDLNDWKQSHDVLESMILHAAEETNRLQEDKKRAEEARDTWVERASYRVIQIIRALKKMENSMVILNQNKHRFPLVQMSLKRGSFPEQPEEIKSELNDFFLRTMERLIKTYGEVENVPDAEWETAVNDGEVVHVAFHRRFPTLMVYKPQTTNSFLYETPKGHHYTEWQTLNKGSYTEAKGSGGQLLAARTIVMMMLITYRRQQQAKQWTVLISDNPFGQAISEHILDPIFAIAENLHFQWIVVSPPELIKLDVSRRFPVYWELKLDPFAHGEQIVEKLHHGGRQYKDELSLFDY